MADIGEEMALDFVHLHQLVIAFLQQMTISVQLEPRREFRKPQLAVEIASHNHDHACKNEKIEIVHQQSQIPWNRRRLPAVQTAHREIKQDDQQRCGKALAKSPLK